MTKEKILEKWVDKCNTDFDTIKDVEITLEEKGTDVIACLEYSSNNLEFILRGLVDTSDKRVTSKEEALDKLCSKLYDSLEFYDKFSDEDKELCHKGDLLIEEARKKYC
jgi:hypothetical protein